METACPLWLSASMTLRSASSSGWEVKGIIWKHGTPWRTPVFYTDPLIRAIPPSARPGRHETFVAIDALAPDHIELPAHIRQLPRHRGLEELPAFGIVGQARCSKSSRLVQISGRA